VNIVVENFSHGILDLSTCGSAQLTAKPTLVRSQAWMISHPFVLNANKSFSITNTSRRHSVHRNVLGNHVTQVQYMKHGRVQSAMNHLQQETIASRSIVHEPARVVAVSSIRKNSDTQDVYNLTVESDAVSEGEYFANGILCHNCDATRYMVAHMDLQPNSVSYFKGGLFK